LIALGKTRNGGRLLERRRNLSSGCRAVAARRQNRPIGDQRLWRGASRSKSGPCGAADRLRFANQELGPSFRCLNYGAGLVRHSGCACFGPFERSASHCCPPRRVGSQPSPRLRARRHLRQGGTRWRDHSRWDNRRSSAYPVTPGREVSDAGGETHLFRGRSTFAYKASSAVRPLAESIAPSCANVLIIGQDHVAVAGPITFAGVFAGAHTITLPQTLHT
jgi:hypothetical protein